MRQAVEDCEGDPEAANKQLEQIGFNIGSRLIDEFIAKNDGEPCRSFKDVVERVALGFKMFAGVDVSLSQRSEQEFAFSFRDNPLDMHVHVPDELRGLSYSNVLCGIVRGACEAVNVRVRCHFVSDKLAPPADHYEMRVELEELIRKKLVDYDD